MTPKEKAKELLNKMFNAYTHKEAEQAKQCALIAVNEIIDVVYGTDDDGWQSDYWQQVKREIENL